MAVTSYKTVWKLCIGGESIALEAAQDSLLGGDVVSLTVALNGPVTPVLVTAAT